MAIVGSLLVTVASAAYGFRPERPEIPRIAPEDFPIIPWGWTPGDAQALAEIWECGFNLAGFIRPEHVDMVQDAGLKCIVHHPSIANAVSNQPIEDDEIARRVAEATDAFKDHPAVFGYYLKDEPTVDWYPNLARWRAAVVEADPDALPYINLLPVGAQGPGVDSYEEYVDRFITEVGAGYVSYDHYTLRDDGSVSPTLFLNLQIMREYSKKHGIPFWNIVLANSHFRYASPTAGGLRLQVFSTLAYGGRGISYFTYFAPLTGNYREAAVDQFLNKTPTWDILRNINLQIHCLGPTYLQLDSVNVFHHPNVPEGCAGDLSTSRFIEDVSGGGDFLVGEFVHADGRPFVMVVNKNITTSTAFGVQFKEPGRVMMTNPYTGETHGWSGENNWLAPGQGMLLSLEKE